MVYRVGGGVDGLWGQESRGRMGDGVRSRLRRTWLRCNRLFIHASDRICLESTSKVEEKREGGREGKGGKWFRIAAFGHVRGKARCGREHERVDGRIGP